MRCDALEQGHSQGVEVYAPQGTGLPMDAHNQLQAFLAQVPPQTHMNQQQMMQLLQLQAMIQAQSNGQVMPAGKNAHVSLPASTNEIALVKYGGFPNVCKLARPLVLDIEVCAF